MELNKEFGSISFDLPKNQSNVIKVIGVGGGGSNAINHMFSQGIVGVDFVICNTDAQALQNSPVPIKIQLGVNLTEGLGAGANPDVGYQAAIESVGDIEKLLDTNTKMVFITAGMGGGTGTGAAPVLAQMAKERDILTVGIVTIPFEFEGKNRKEQALAGLEKFKKQVDSLIVINNNKLREVYGNLGFKAGFSKADEVLATAAKGIAEVITHHYTQNIDLKDAKTVLSDSGTAIMGSAKAEGNNRAKEGIIAALDSPLLNDNKITGAKNVLLLIVSGSSEITIDEIGEINDYIQQEAGHSANIIMGIGEDETLGEAINITVIATGFNIDQQEEIVNTQPKKIVHPLTEEQKNEIDLSPKQVEFNVSPNEPLVNEIEDVLIYDLEASEIEIIDDSSSVNQLIETTDFIKNIDVTFEIVSEQNNMLIETTDDLLNIPVFGAEIISEHKQIIPEDIEVKQPVTLFNVTEVEDKGVIKHSLEEYMEVENQLLDSKPDNTQSNDNFDIKIKEPNSTQKPLLNLSADVDPTDLTIEETMRLKNEARSTKLKKFNYNFNNSLGDLNELENEPAYKRSGIELDDSTESSASTKTRISNNQNNNDLFFGRSNSFLHDNVD